MRPIRGSSRWLARWARRRRSRCSRRTSHRRRKHYCDGPAPRSQGLAVTPSRYHEIPSTRSLVHRLEGGNGPVGSGRGIAERAEEIVELGDCEADRGVGLARSQPVGRTRSPSSAGSHAWARAARAARGRRQMPPPTISLTPWSVRNQPAVRCRFEASPRARRHAAESCQQVSGKERPGTP